MTDAIKPTSNYVFEATEQSFEIDVIQASLTTPVLVDFWAAWCEPCKVLAPILEKVVASYAGAIRLAKVDTEAQAQLAGIFGIRSLPTVVLVKDGQMIDGFTGALAESGVREFVKKHLGEPPAPVAEAADAVHANESPVERIARLQSEIAAKDHLPDLEVDLAVAFFDAGDIDTAQTQLDALPANLAQHAKALRLRARIELARAALAAPDVEVLRAKLAQNQADHEARDQLGVALLGGEDPALGLDEFLTLLRTARAWNDGLAKKRLIAAFSVLDDADLVGTYRRKMASLLF